MEDALELKFLEGSAMPLFVVEVLVFQARFQVIEGNCVRLGVLLLAKLNQLRTKKKSKKPKKGVTTSFYQHF